MNRQTRRAAKAKPEHPPVPETWAELLARCPFRSYLALGEPASAAELASRIGATFASIGGEICPIEGENLNNLVDTILAGSVVLVLADRADLRHAAKMQIMRAVNVARLGAAGSA